MTDAEIDHVHERVDEAFRASEFPQINLLLAGLDPATLSADMIITLLTTTLPAKNHLPARRYFYRASRSRLTQLGYEPEPLLRGLE